MLPKTSFYLKMYPPLTVSSITTATQVTQFILKFISNAVKSAGMSACPLPSRVAVSCLCQEEEEDGGDGVFFLLSLGFAGSWLCVLQPLCFNALGLSLGSPRGKSYTLIA